MKKLVPLVCLCLCFVGCQESDRASWEKLQKDLPVGTPADRVEKVLTNAKIEHSLVTKENAFHAIIRGAGKSSSMIREDISLVIILDDKQCVKEIDAKKVFTGP